jgi:hypothetical protein
MLGSELIAGQSPGRAALIFGRAALSAKSVLVGAGAALVAGA